MLLDSRKDLMKYRLEMDGKDFSKHSGVIVYFQKEYIKSGKIEKKYSKYISQAFQIRNSTDYADFFIVSVQDAQEQYEKCVWTWSSNAFFCVRRTYAARANESEEIQWKYRVMIY